MAVRPAVLIMCVLLAASALDSCSRLRARSAACREPQIPVTPGNNAPLKVGPGQDLPDTRNAIRVPELNEPEKPRGKNDPCLSRPPSFGS